MTTAEVKVKFGKDVHTVVIDTSAPVAVFRAQLQSVTGVPADGQKVMGVPGGVLKDDADLSKMGLHGKTLMLLGTAATVSAAPSKPVVFAEDIKDSSGHAKDIIMSNGLENLGNSCYLNSAVQTLRAIPELRNFLSRSDNPMARALYALFRQLDSTKTKVVPENFFRAFLSTFRRFNERKEGQLMQHDTQEALQSLVECIEGINTPGLSVPPLKESTAASASSGGGAAAAAASSETPQQDTAAPKEIPLPPNCAGLMVGTQRDTIKTEETGDVRYEDQVFSMLRCEIPQDVQTLESAIEKALKATWTNENPENLQHFTRTAQLTGLPQYLFCQMVRFAWRADSNSKAKVLRPVAFPMVLDVTNFCSKELKEQLLPQAEKVRQYRDDYLEYRKNLRKAEIDKKAAAAAPASAAAAAQNAGKVNDDDSQSGDAVKPLKIPQPAVSGLYELCAVISHKGRDADHGHYVAWVKKAGSWLIFDDDHCGPVSVDDVLRLKGVGEAHIAYILLYRAFDPETGEPPLLL